MDDEAMDDLVEGTLDSFSDEELSIVRTLMLGGLLGNLTVLECERGEERILVLGVHIDALDGEKQYMVPMAILASSPQDFEGVTHMGKPFLSPAEAKAKVKEIFGNRRPIGPGSDLVQ